MPGEMEFYELYYARQKKKRRSLMYSKGTNYMLLLTYNTSIVDNFHFLF